MKTAADVIQTLQDMKKKGAWTWSELASPQGELDAIDAARYAPNAPPASDEDIEKIDMAYGMRASARAQRVRRGGSRAGRGQ